MLNVNQTSQFGVLLPYLFNLVYIISNQIFHKCYIIAGFLQVWEFWGKVGISFWAAGSGKVWELSLVGGISV